MAELPRYVVEHGPYRILATGESHSDRDAQTVRSYRNELYFRPNHQRTYVFSLAYIYMNLHGWLD